MTKHILLALTAIACLTISCSKKRSGKPRVLVFSKTADYVHASIPRGVEAIQKLGADNGFDVDTSRNADIFNEDSLKNYSAVIFLSTTGDVLDHRQEIAFERYIQAGGGFAGIHAATDTEYDWGWYGRMVGAYFESHPRTQSAKFIIRDKSFAATSFFTDTIWQHRDELYNFKKLNPEVKVILTIDESSYEGGTNGAHHPMSWYHEYDGGRAFYTALGHTNEAYADSSFLKHLLGGIEYAIGDNHQLNYKKARSEYPPDEDRFTKITLAQGEFTEPTEMTILPNLDILVVQRRGEILLYKHETKQLKQAGLLNVYWKATVPDVNAEEGLMGLAKDPQFAKNNWVYMYYSPIDSSVNRLSRFTLSNDTIDLKSEKTILEVKSQRNICCHTGGSIAFGRDGLLYLSTGDNSTPFDEPNVKYVNSGYGPMNDLPGREQYDARRSSANTNDLRGKIIRIKINDDGSYDIPEGNLFPKGMDKTRPEIYVMGNRNPYRIAVDQKNSNLYWGEVGPDAANDSFATRGPRGYDEVNQARQAGFFGWPLFVGNNYAYRQYDYATGQSGELFNAQRPVNDSRNNTGLRELPAAQPAFIWYPYGPSHDFPQVGTGGRNAMAGPVYYTDMFPKATRLPDYYNGKLIIYEWIRGWIKAVTLLPNGDFDKMEPFLQGIKVNALMDMEVGPDGKLYFLEYGSGWFSQNADAGLFRIDYNSGNRAPKIASVSVDKTSGTLPFAIKVKVDATDPENDPLNYTWYFGDGKSISTDTPEAGHTYDAPGDYKIYVTVKDRKGDSTVSNTTAVYAGNEEPVVTIQQTAGNRSFYLPGRAIGYAVKVTDNDTAQADPANLYVSADYVEGFDKAGASMGHQQGQALVSGKSLTQTLDCKSCHKEAEKSIGPSFRDVAEKYGKDPDALHYLSQKILKGSKGVWGEVAMAPHPTLATGDVQAIVTWVLSLNRKAEIKKSLPISGQVIAATDKKANSTLVISASYTDKGGVNSKALTGSNVFSLASNHVAFTEKQEMKGFDDMYFNSILYLIVPQNEGWFAMDSIDLNGVGYATAITAWQNITPPAFELELRLDSPAGKLIGKGKLSIPDKNEKKGFIRIPVDFVNDAKLHKLYFVYKPAGDKKVSGTGISMIRFDPK